MTNLILIDGKNALFRFGYAHKYLQDSLHRPTGALYGMAGELLRLKNKFSPCRFVMVWDGEATHTLGWRMQHFPEYKQHRLEIQAKADEEAKEVRRKVLAQIKPVKTLMRVLSIPQVEIRALEADDAIALIAMHALVGGFQPVIYSTDKDFFQLIPLGCKVVRFSKDSKKPFVDDDLVMEKFRCCSKDVLAVRAFTGDDSDGIPMAHPQIGPARASLLVSVGINPALSYKQQPLKIAGQHPWLKEKWPIIQRNYQIMGLLKDMEDARLTGAQKLQLKTQVRLAMAHRPTIEYNEMLEFFGDYELNEAIQNRKGLFELHAV